MKILKIAFIPTAGGRKRVHWKNIKLPFFFTWPICKWFYGILGIRAEHLEELKTETIARLQKSLQIYNNTTDIEKFYLSGGLSSRKKSVVELMRDWLLLNAYCHEMQVIMDDETLQTSDKAEKFISYLKEGEFDVVEVQLVTSWYHIRRCTYEIQRAIKKHELTSYVEITAQPVYPPLTCECLKYEYIYNILTEPLKLVMMHFDKFKDWYRDKEKKAREA